MKGAAGNQHFFLTCRTDAGKEYSGQVDHVLAYETGRDPNLAPRGAAEANMQRKRLLTFFLVVLPLVIAGAGTAEANWTGYMLITDDSGPIEGPDFTPTGTPNAIYVTEFHHLVLTDEGTTAPYQKPFVFTKRMDRTSSRLFQAFAQDEPLTIIFKVDDNPQLLFEFEFTHARIVAMEPLSETTESLPGQEYEKIRFIYSTITVRDIAAGTEVAWALAGWPA